MAQNIRSPSRKGAPRPDQESPTRIDGFPKQIPDEDRRLRPVDDGEESLTLSEYNFLYGDDEDSIDSNEEMEKDAEELTNLAIDLQGRGREDEALDVYERAMQKARCDLIGCKRYISKPNSQPNEELMAQTKELAAEIEGTIADIRFQMGILYELREDYDRAKTSCWGAVHVYHAAGQTGHEEIVKQKLKLIESARESKAKRKEIHAKAEGLARRVAFVTDPDHQRSIKCEIIETLNEVLKLEKKNLGWEHPVVANTMMKIGAWFFEQNLVDEALQVMEPAVSILETQIGPYHPMTGKALLSIASVYNDEERWEQAQKYYKRALSALRACVAVDRPREGATLYHLGVALYSSGRFEEAMESLSDSLLAYTAAGLGIHPDTAHVWVAMGNVYRLRNEWEDAVMAYANALAVVRDMHWIAKHEEAMVPAECIVYRNHRSVMNNEFLAETLERMGTAEEKLCRYGEAMEKFERVQKINLDFQAKFPTAERKTKIAQVTYRIGSLKQSSGKLVEAMSYYIESIRMLRELENVECLLASVLKDTGSIHIIRRQYDEAIGVLEDARALAIKSPDDSTLYTEIDKMLAPIKPTEPVALVSSNSSVCSTGGTSKDETSSQVSIASSAATQIELNAERMNQAGDYGGAVQGYEKALNIRRARTKAKPNRDQRQEIANNLYRIAKVHEANENREEAEVMFREALDMYESIGMTRQDPVMQELIKAVDSMRYADI